jgi:mycothiol synthase
MSATYTWSPRVERLIDALPLAGGRLPIDDGGFWSVVEAAGDTALPPEVLAYLVRIAYAQNLRGAVDRLFGLIWDRYAAHVVAYARRYSARLQRMVAVEDVVVDVFALLAERLRKAAGVTFYEACFLLGLKRLTLDKVQRLADEPLLSLTVGGEDGEEEEQREFPDPGAVDPQAQALDSERLAALHRALPVRLHGLPDRVLQTAVLLMAGRGEKEIAEALGVSTRMVTNYKATLRRALAEFQFVVRHCEPRQDLPRLLDLYSTAYASDGRDAATGADEVLKHMNLPGHDPARDRWVVSEQEDGELLLATCMVWKPAADARADMDLLVHPDWRRRGLGTALLSHAVERAGALGAEHIGAYARDAHPAAAAFARRHGFQPVAAFCDLRAGPEIAPPPPRWPDSLAVVTYDQRADPTLLLQALNRCYAGQWGHHTVTAADLATFLPQWQPDGIFLALAPSGEVAGIVRAELPHADSNGHAAAHIDAPGVVPEFRHTDLRSALVLAAFHWIRDAGCAEVGLLSWGDDDRTISLYQSLGFAITRKSIYHQRPLRG